MAKPLLQSVTREKMQDHSGTMHAHPLYNTWRGMVERCTSKNSHAYSRYGGKGIKVCEEWISKDRDVFNKKWSAGFCAFLNYVADCLGEKAEGETLDRILNTGHYEPGNIRWADQSLQKKNQKIANSSGYKYVYKVRNSNKWSADYKFKGKRFYVGIFETKEKAYFEALAHRLETMWYNSVQNCF